MIKNHYKKINSCPITNKKNSFVFLNLGDMPIVNNLLKTKKQAINVQKYELAVQYFSDSKLTVVTNEINSDKIFGTYVYKSGVSHPYKEHCKNMYLYISKYIKLKKDDLVLDIGGNDGTLLKEFLCKNNELKVLNIDASKNICQISKENGIPTKLGYWGTTVAKKINKKFKLIVTTNVYQHTAPVNDFTKAIKLSLDTDGIWCLEFPYWKTTMETNQFDQIYHEHIYYYLITPIKKLLHKHNLKIINAKKINIHGGSMRLLITHKECKKYDSQICKTQIKTFLKEESKIKKNEYKNWGLNINKHILNCKNFLLNLKDKNKNIVGFGAAAKGCVFLNSAKIDDTILDVVIDDTDLKQNKFIPGVGIQIVNREYLKKNKVDYILILAHNFKKEIIKNLQNEYKGKFITLFPTPHIYN